MSHFHPASDANPWVSAWRRVAAAALLGLALGAQAANRDPVVPGELMVKLQSGAALPRLLTKYRLSLVDRFGARPIYRLKVVGSTTVEATLTALAAEPSVLLAEANVVHSTPEARKNNFWAIGTRQAYATQWAPEAMHLAEAHQLSTGVGVRVAVLDTGVDRHHPALAGRLLPGFDFVDFDADPSEVGSLANEGFGHGTHVAGLVAMVAPSARIMPLRVLDANGQGNAWVLAEALLYAVDPDGNPATDDGAHVINMSLGSLQRTSLFKVISELVSCSPPDPVAPTDFSDPGYDDDKLRCTKSRGALVVAAAGNGGSTRLREFPAAESAYGKLAVGASAPGDVLAPFSNYGSWVDLAAPGDRLTSTIPGGGYATWSGTSMAAPLVTGTFALVRSLHRSWTPDQIGRRIVRSTSRLCKSPLRQLDAQAALLNLVPPDPVCP